MPDPDVYGTRGEIRQGGKPRPAQEAASLLDNLGCRLHKFIRKRDALLLGGSRVDEEFEVVAAFEGDVAGFFTLQNARHHAAGLFAEIAVVDAHRSDRATHHAVGVGGDEGHLGVDTYLHQRLVGRHHAVVGVGVDDIDLADQTAGGGTDVDR